MQKLEKQVNSLSLEVGDLKAKLLLVEKECKVAKVQANASVEALLRVKDVVKQPCDVLIKAQLYDEMIKNLHLSRSKIGEFITMYATKVEAALVDMRIVVGEISFAMPSQNSSTCGFHSKSHSKSSLEGAELDGDSQQQRKRATSSSQDSDLREVSPPPPHATKSKKRKAMTGYQWEIVQAWEDLKLSREKESRPAYKPEEEVPFA